MGSVCNVLDPLPEATTHDERIREFDFGEFPAFFEPKQDPGFILDLGALDSVAECYAKLRPQFEYLKEFFGGNTWPTDAQRQKWQSLYDEFEEVSKEAAGKDEGAAKELFTRAGHQHARKLWRELRPLRYELNELLTYGRYIEANRAGLMLERSLVLGEHLQGARHDDEEEPNDNGGGPSTVA